MLPPTLLQRPAQADARQLDEPITQPGQGQHNAESQQGAGQEGKGHRMLAGVDPPVNRHQQDHHRRVHQIEGVADLAQECSEPVHQQLPGGLRQAREDQPIGHALQVIRHSQQIGQPPTNQCKESKNAGNEHHRALRPPLRIGRIQPDIPEIEQATYREDRQMP